MTSEGAMAKKKAAKKVTEPKDTKTPDKRDNYYRRTGKTVINVGLSDDDRARVQAYADTTGAKLGPALWALARHRLEELESQ